MVCCLHVSLRMLRSLLLTLLSQAESFLNQSPILIYVPLYGTPQLFTRISLHGLTISPPTSYTLPVCCCCCCCYFRQKEQAQKSTNRCLTQWDNSMYQYRKRSGRLRPANRPLMLDPSGSYRCNFAVLHSPAVHRNLLNHWPNDHLI